MSTYIEGKHKRTFKQLKKHVSAISFAEKCYLQNELANSWAKNQRFTISDHLQEEIDNGTRLWDEEVAKHTISNFWDTLIEYNERKLGFKPKTRRVLLRSQKTMRFNGRTVQMCFVVQLGCMTVVTSYPCAVDDRHETLNDKLYCNNLDIIQ